MNKRLMDKIIQTWADTGSHPAYHRKMQEQLRKEWPILAKALDEAAGRNKDGE